MAFKKILVALDRSAQADQVFAQALDLAQREMAKLLILHCLNVDADDMPSDNPLFSLRSSTISVRVKEEWLLQELERVDSWLATYVERAQQAGIAVESVSKVGSPTTWIRDLAKSWQADLIILGRRGRSLVTAVLLGSVSNYVIHHAPCSVLIVQGVTP
ncbi:universal stress protein [Trichothermofontia sp.]